MEMKKNRAMTSEDKEIKANHILDVAIGLFEKSTFKEIKMIDIANEAEISKGLLFKYYATKETLFIEMLDKKNIEREKKLLELFKPYDNMEYKEFKKIFLEELEEILDVNSIMIRLMALLHTILENNIDEKTALTINEKREKFLNNFGEIMENKVNGLKKAQCIELLKVQHALIVGYINMANIPIALREYKNVRFKREFKENVLKAMGYYIDGMILAQYR